jgi:leucyl aminopeptidase
MNPTKHELLVRFAAASGNDGPLAFPLAAGASPPADRLSLAADDAALLNHAVAAARFTGEAGSIAEVVLKRGGGARRILLVGVGNGTARETGWQKAGSALAARLLTSGDTMLEVDLRGLNEADRARAAAHIAFGADLRAFQYHRRSKVPAKSAPSLAEIVLVGGGDAAEAAWNALKPVADGIRFTRELVTEPANIIYPESFVERCEGLRDLGIEVEALDEEAMAALGMNALLGVSLGSEKPARLLVLRWNGTGAAGNPPLALVGKGVTFDTGGISIKAAAGMEDMKWDMGGAGAVAGAIHALAARKAKVHVVGVCGLVENMPDGKAQRPGDVVTSMSGQTIEVINTDAEGRLVLCDALTWVQRVHRPATIVDLATLTGAMIVALGHEHGGLFANDESLAEQLLAAGLASGDKLWRLPLGEPYDKLIDSPIADMKNVGPRDGGSITAAQFLKRYIDDGVRWAHLDIAGMVWAAKPGTLHDKGATGYGVRLLDRFVADNFEA